MKNKSNFIIFIYDKFLIFYLNLDIFYKDFYIIFLDILHI